MEGPKGPHTSLGTGNAEAEECTQESAVRVGRAAAPPTAQDSRTGWAPAGLKAVRPLRAPPATRWVAGGTAEPLTLGVSVSPGNTWGCFRVPSGQRAPRRASSQKGAPARRPPSWRAGRPPGAGLAWLLCWREPPVPRTRACLGAGQSPEEEGGASGGGVEGEKRNGLGRVRHVLSGADLRRTHV